MVRLPSDVSGSLVDLMILSIDLLSVGHDLLRNVAVLSVFLSEQESQIV
jgi:hypothetical protein